MIAEIRDNGQLDWSHSFVVECPIRSQMRSAQTSIAVVSGTTGDSTVIQCGGHCYAELSGGRIGNTGISTRDPRKPHTHGES